MYLSTSHSVSLCVVPVLWSQGVGTTSTLSPPPTERGWGEFCGLQSVFSTLPQITSFPSAPPEDSETAENLCQPLFYIQWWELKLFGLEWGHRAGNHDLDLLRFVGLPGPCSISGFNFHMQFFSVIVFQLPYFTQNTVSTFGDFQGLIIFNSEVTDLERIPCAPGIDPRTLDSAVCVLK